ncbi:mCG141822, partial [Mus musculus]
RAGCSGRKLVCPSESRAAQLHITSPAVHPLWGPRRQEEKGKQPIRLVFASAICTSVEPSTWMRESEVGDGGVLRMECKRLLSLATCFS